MCQEQKKRLFLATVDSVLLYGCEAWTLSVKDETQLNGCYTRMLRMALDVAWSQKIRNEVLYKDMPKVTDKIRERRLRLAGHCVRHSELEASDLVLWEPTQGKLRRGNQKATFIDMLKRDTGLHSECELRSLMQDRSGWNAIARGNSR